MAAAETPITMESHDEMATAIKKPFRLLWNKVWRVMKIPYLPIIAVFLFILGLYVSPRSSVAAVHLIMGGEFTFLFWFFVVGIGILVPLSLEVYELIPHYIQQVELREHNPWISGIITTSVLIGGFAMRYIVIYAGQMAQIISS